jgi:DNA-binding transcriptional ArsR family regulator
MITNKIKAYIDQQGWKMNSVKNSITLKLSEEPQTLASLSKALSKPQSTIAARLSELNDAGIVIPVPQEGRFSLYRLAIDEEIDTVVLQRKIERFIRWHKEGVESGFFNILNGE